MNIILCVQDHRLFTRACFSVRMEQKEKDKGKKIKKKEQEQETRAQVECRMVCTHAHACRTLATQVSY